MTNRYRACFYCLNGNTQISGGFQETQDMVNFCAQNKITPEITKIPMNGIDDAWKRVLAVLVAG